MIKYALISILLYYLFINFLRPKTEKNIPNTKNDTQQNLNKNNHDDEYVDYEEVN